MKRLVLIAIVLVMALALVIPANAAGTPRFSFTNASWAVGCIYDYGLVVVDVDIYVPGSFYYTVRQTNTTGLNYTETIYLQNNYFSWTQTAVPVLAVPVGHSAETIYDVYSEDGQLLATGGAYGSCVTGELRSWGSEASDVNPPDPWNRVLGTVMADTPVYSQPDAGGVVDGAVLTAGQTWFVVDAMNGADGGVWYKVFVGGLYYGWVPSNVMILDGPLP